MFDLNLYLVSNRTVNGEIFGRPDSLLAVVAPLDDINAVNLLTEDHRITIQMFEAQKRAPPKNGRQVIHVLETIQEGHLIAEEMYEDEDMYEEFVDESEETFSEEPPEPVQEHSPRHSSIQHAEAPLQQEIGHHEQGMPIKFFTAEYIESDD